MALARDKSLILSGLGGSSGPRRARPARELTDRLRYRCPRSFPRPFPGLLRPRKGRTTVAVGGDDGVVESGRHTLASARSARSTDVAVTPRCSGHVAELDDGQEGSILVGRDHELESSVHRSPEDGSGIAARAWMAGARLEGRQSRGGQLSAQHFAGRRAAERLVWPMLDVPLHVRGELFLMAERASGTSRRRTHSVIGVHRVFPGVSPSFSAPARPPGRRGSR